MPCIRISEDEILYVVFIDGTYQYVLGTICDLLLEMEMVSSKSEARRLVRQGSVTFIYPNHERHKIDDEMLWFIFTKGEEIIAKVGKRKFKRIKAQDFSHWKIDPWFYETYVEDNP